jgi:ABC-type glycerol-3-phosphate transport system substrate-binding protein
VQFLWQVVPLKLAESPGLKLRFVWLGLVLIALFLIFNTCRGPESPLIATSEPRMTETAPPQVSTSASLATATRIIDLGLEASLTPGVGEPFSQPTQTAAATLPPDQTELPQQAPASTSASDLGGSQGEVLLPGEQPYPGVINVPEAYPGAITLPETYPGILPGEEPENEYPAETGGIFGAAGQSNPTLPPPTPTPAPVTPLPTAAQATSPAATPPRLAAASTPTFSASGVFKPLVIPPDGPNPVVEIWHALEGSQLHLVEAVVRTYQESNPQVSVLLAYFPKDDLRAKYETAIYQGRGPDLLIGPSDWNAAFSRSALAADLTPYFPSDFWQAFAIPALATGRLHDQQTSIPFTMSGVVLYRNKKIIPGPAASLELLEQSARQATRGGVIGAYFDLGAFQAMAFYSQMGGQWLDDAGRPTFDRAGYSDALEWLSLLAILDRIGAVEVNTSRDTSLFVQGKVGYILDGTWNLQVLAQGVGEANLAVDPWPSYKAGSLSGYVQAQSLYLNPAAASRYDARLYAALQFIGAITSPQAQRRLAEAGFVPVRRDLQLQDALMRQVVAAMQNSVAFPPVLQDPIRQVYWTAIEDAVRRSLGIGAQPTSQLEALRQAYQEISTRLTAILR